MRRLQLFVTLVLVLSFFARSPDPVHADYLGDCHHAADSTLSRPDGVVIRYEYWGKALVLVSLQSGEVVQTLESSLVTSDLNNLNWSPDCHYLFGTANGEAVIWDAINGGRAATFENVIPKNPPYWNPGHDNMILEAHGGSYLWNFGQGGTPILLTFSGQVSQAGYWYFNWQVEWDNARNQVLVAPNYAGGSIVIAYDQTTAEQIAFFDNGDQQGPVQFTVTPDDSHVIVFTSENEAFPGYNKGITIWDRSTMAHVTLDANYQSAVLPGQVALSPDGSTLVLARIGTMRVWDLTHLANDIQARDPIHRYPIEATTRSVRFVSNTVVETTDLNGNTTQWDLVTGARVS